jgi:hypothetical protein
MKPIITEARDYFVARFHSGDDEGTLQEERFKDVLVLGRLASLLRLHMGHTPAELTAIVAAAPRRLLQFSADKDKIKDEWTAARALALPPGDSHYKEPATSDSPHHVSKNGEYCYQWWVRHATEFPAMLAMARRMVILQPSSAASERVFSLFKRVNDSSPSNTLMDLKRARVMVPYNDRMRKQSVVPSH